MKKVVLLFLYVVLQSSAQTQPRTVGIEAGVQFGLFRGNPTTPNCTFGEYVRASSSSFSNVCNFSPYAVGDNTWLINTMKNFTTNTVGPPYAQAGQYVLKLLLNGALVDACYSTSFLNPSPTNVVLTIDLSQQAARNNLLNTFLPGLLARGPNTKRNPPPPNDAAHPTVFPLDAWYISYAAIGGNPPGTASCTHSGITWPTGKPQNEAQWQAFIAQLFLEAKTNHPEYRLFPHIGSYDAATYANLQTTYANVPGQMKEPFNESDLTAAYKKAIYWGQITTLSWFTNQAKPVFSSLITPSEPASRIIYWATWVADNPTNITRQKIHTALAFYLIARGPNTFPDMLYKSPQYALNLSQWKPIMDAIGPVAGSQLFTIPIVASGHVVSNGYNLYKRIYPKGIAYLNMTGGTRVISTTGCKDSNGNLFPGNQLSLPDGQGEVMFSSTSTTCTQ